MPLREDLQGKGFEHIEMNGRKLSRAVYTGNGVHFTEARLVIYGDFTAQDAEFAENLVRAQKMFEDQRTELLTDAVGQLISHRYIHDIRELTDAVMFIFDGKQEHKGLNIDCSLMFYSQRASEVGRTLIYEVLVHENHELNKVQYAFRTYNL